MTERLAQETLSAAAMSGRVYLAVKATGPVGVSAGALKTTRAFRSLNTTVVQNALYRLKGLGYITLDRKGCVYSVDDTCAVPTMRYPRPSRAALLEMVADCEAGLAVEVLASEFGTSAEVVLEVLGRDLTLARVLRVTLPDSHGGGIALLPNLRSKAATRPARVAEPTPRLPELVMPTFLDSVPAAPKPAAGRGVFELLPTGQFSLGWGSFQLVLPRDVTREMFRFLDRLGGLDTEARLGQAGPDQAADAGAAS